MTLHGRVLAAASQPSERSWLAATLGTFGLQRVIVPDSDGMLQAFLSADFDMLVIDAGLPGAAEACALVRQQAPQLPVMVLAGPGAPIDIPDAIATRRPLDRHRLHRLLADRLGRAQTDLIGADGSDDALAAQLAELRRAYIGRLDASVLRPMQAAADDGDWQTVRQVAHRLSGTAGCHGLLAVAAAAAALESALLSSPAAAPDALAPLLAALTRAAAETIAGTSQ